MPPPVALKVLVVDDNADGREALILLLQALGCETAVAADGLSGLSVARSFLPDVAVVDLQMPVMDGHELGRLLREGDAAHRMVLIAHSGQDAESARPLSLAVGFDEFVPKPIDPAWLARRIAEWRRPGPT
jgi:CheY-like chemotaxis protein